MVTVDRRLIGLAAATRRPEVRMKKNVMVGALAALVFAAWLLAANVLSNRNAELGRSSEAATAA